jgi:putative ATP-binding cassette transporter
LAPWAFGYILIAVYKFYLTQSLELRWRTWMPKRLMGQWLSANAFHRIEAQSKGADNPDQRIQEDVTQFTSETISLTLGFLEASLTLGSFVGILWSLSGTTNFSIAGTTYAISGFMLWMAAAYAAAGSYIAHWLGKSLPGLNAKNQMLEANFRHHLVRVRDLSESIAFERGSSTETSSLTRRFAQVVDNLWITLKVQKRFTWFSSGYTQASVVFQAVRLMC